MNIPLTLLELERLRMKTDARGESPRARTTTISTLAALRRGIRALVRARTGALP